MQLELQKRLTQDFINTDPVVLTLIPRTTVPDGSGGRKKVTQAPRLPQTFTLIEPSDSGFQLPIATDSGQQYTVQYMLLGTVDAIMEAGDVFVWDGKEYKLEAIMPFNGYERRAVVIRHGW